MSEKIIPALKALDVSNDNHWTTTGEPRLDTIRFSTGLPALKREELEKAAPGFNRSNAATWEPASGATAHEDATNLGDTQEGTDGSAEQVAKEAQPEEVEEAQEELASLEQIQAQYEEEKSTLDQMDEALAAINVQHAEQRALVDALLTKLDAHTPKRHHNDVMVQMEAREASRKRREQRALENAELTRKIRGL